MMSALMSSGDRSKTNEILESLKKHDNTRYEPYFKPEFGFSYNELESFNLKEQINFFEALERAGVAVPAQALFTILKCDTCGYHYFSIKCVCTFCRSSNIVRGTAIEHDSCGNIDFDYKFLASDGKLRCDKCQKELKALGVDYSKINYFYKCQECNAMLPEIERLYGCLQCAKFSRQDELQILHLFKYNIKPEKLSAEFDKSSYVSSIKDRLDKIGIRSVFSDAITGASSIMHTFDLVVYDKQDRPLVVLLILESPLNGSDDDEATVLSLIGRCLDVNISNKILISSSKLKDRAKILAQAYGVNVIETSDHHDNHHLTTVVDTVTQLCNSTKNKDASL
jgi:hypothetical protein